MKNIVKILSGVLFLVVLIVACKKDKKPVHGGGGPAGGTNTLNIKVLDENGSPVEGATVKCGNVSATSGSDGSAKLSNVPTPDEKFKVEVNKDNFFPGFKNVLYQGNSTALSATIKLLQRDMLGKVSADHAGNLQGNKYRMELSGQGFKKTDGTAATGEITVYARYIDASDLETLAELMPGGDFAAIGAGQEEGILESYGFTATEFRDEAGNRVVPNEGAAAMAITLSQQAADRINSIGGADVWYFDETAFTWTVGSAVSPGNTEVMIPVTSSTFGNCDKINSKATFKAKFYCGGPDTPLVGQAITLRGQSGYAMVYRTESNASGNVLIEVGIPSSGGTYQMQINDYTQNVTFSAGETVDLGDIDVCGLVGQEGNPRFNLQWSSDSDLDLYCQTPSGDIISYMDEVSSDGGELDVDMMCEGGQKSENIFWATSGPSGTYTYWVVNFGGCGSEPNVTSPFTIIVRNNGVEVVRRTGTLNTEDEVSTKWTFIKP